MQIILAYTNSDTLIPELKIFSSKESARKDIKEHLDTKNCQVISDEEIDELLRDLNCKKAIWGTLYSSNNDCYEIVATGLLIGDKK
ncbi:hypothetical protein DMB95_08755 [Campylobacter sp. MIT 12-8780]|uniref:hypothetical protein n=1 Tax=unclassified Campylobacter TaxID=2593542 RepID=UPI00115F5280|nr:MULTISPECIES: hypothetical protein [unclassified Campylobacter]NDJ27958.1 hypothetical protein [Campylobacter sp. MIT 19-121]TQR40110.1 hypothetical protein DMB95_08755 [Campylobacter sp. MIT 12-8780]